MMPPCPTCGRSPTPAEELATAILALHREGLSVADIAARVKREPRTVQRVLREAGEGRPKGRPRKVAFI